MMTECERLLNVLRDLIDVTEGVMPGWSFPLDNGSYTCVYCGAISTAPKPHTIVMTHTEECPIGIGMLLLNSYPNETPPMG